MLVWVSFSTKIIKDEIVMVEFNFYSVLISVNYFLHLLFLVSLACCNGKVLSYNLEVLGLSCGKNLSAYM